MSELLIYQAKVAAVMAVFYLFFRIIVSKESYHRLNRVVLIATPLLSFILPLCVITTTHVVTQEATLTNLLTIDQPSTSPLTNQSSNSHIDWENIFGAIYCIGAVILSVYTIIVYIKIVILIKKSKVIYQDNKSTIYTTKQKITPCNWFKNIILPQSEQCSDANIIIAHEKAHLELNHSYDMLIMNLYCIAQWFNPIVWLIRLSLRNIHEYEADSRVINQGINIKQYQLLLIKKVVGHESYSIANNLNHSSLKNRITMMLSKKSSVVSRLKLLYVVPLIGISLTAFAQTKTVVITQPESKDKQTNVSNQTSNFVSPIGSLPIDIQGEYGKVKGSTDNVTIFHRGVDLKVPTNTPILAAKSGTIKKVISNSKTQGNYIIISHDDGYETTYSHLNSVNVSNSDSVKAGDVIGKAGSTGLSTATHLHFRISKDGKSIDPTPILKSTNQPIEIALHISSEKYDSYQSIKRILSEAKEKHGDSIKIKIVIKKDIDPTEIKNILKNLNLSNVTYKQD